MSAKDYVLKTFHCFSDLPAELRHKIWKFKVDEETSNLANGRIVKLIQRRLKKTVGRWQEMNTDTQQSPEAWSQAMDLPQNIDPDTMSLLTEKEMLALGQTWHLKDTQAALSENLVGMYSPQSLPPTVAALLSVCHESRMVMEKAYSFACGITKPMVFFNFELDTLYLSYKDIHIGSEYLGFERTLLYALDAGKQEDWEKVKFLAIELPADQFRGATPNSWTENQISFQPFMADILRYFPGLKEMSVVLRDYSEADEKDSLILFEPIIPLLAWSALMFGYLENFEDFNSYDYDQGMNIRANYHDILDPLVGSMPAYAEYAEKNGEPPLRVPDLNSLFTKIVIGPTWEKKLEDARQKYLSDRITDMAV
ncbi:hypothetical protein EAF04_006410 [Stromatinia cepivora]|nr:hypothetical protein EAF04_006410 [Stromatinia cepivora]